MTQLQNVDMERIVLGAFMVDPMTFWAVADKVRPELFVPKDFQILCATIKELALSHKPFNQAFVSVRAKTESETNAIVGASVHAYKKAVEDEAAQIGDMIEELMRLYGLRKIKDISSKITGLIATNADPAEISTLAIEEMSDIAAQSTSGRAHNMKSVVENVRTVAVTASKNAEGYGINSDLDGLNEMAGAAYPGDLMLLGATPGGGKTSLALQWAIHAARRGFKGAFFQLEMDNASMFIRLLAGMSGLSSRQVYRGLSQDQYETLYQEGDKVSSLPLTIYDEADQSFEMIKARAMSMKKREGLDFMVVDHVGLIKMATGQKMARHEMVNEIALEMKQLAKRLQIPIMLLCQLTKAGRQKENPRPEMEDFFGGSLETHADLMLCCFDRYEWMGKNQPIAGSGQKKDEWFREREMHKNHKEIYILKNRKDRAGQMKKFYWNGAATRFEDMKPKTQELPYEY